MNAITGRTNGHTTRTDFHTLWLLAFAGLALSSSAAAQQAYDVDLNQSRVYVFVGKSGLGHEHGVEGRLSKGTVRLGATEKAGSLVFDMKSFRADTADARKYVGLSGTTSASTQRQVNDNMLGPKVLHVAKYPTAQLDITSLRALTAKSRDGFPLYELQGRFTLHGRTRAIKLLTELRKEQAGPRLRGGFRIKQTDYGITPFSKAFGAIGVADELRIYGELRLKPQQAARAASQVPGTVR